MYDIKYKLDSIVTGGYNPFHNELLLSDYCCLAYLKEGERGWFLAFYKGEEIPHRVQTSIIQKVVKNNDAIVVSTEHTDYTFVETK